MNWLKYILHVFDADIMESINRKKKVPKLEGPAFFMLDLETLSVPPDRAAVFQIGIVHFDPHAPRDECIIDSCEYSIDLRDSISNGSVRAETLRFWLGQVAESPDKKRLFDGTMSMAAALAQVYEAVTDGRENAKNEKVVIYANPPQFDVSLLEHLLVQHGCEIPWEHWEVRDFRTIASTFKPYFERVYPPEGIAHSAEADAITQAASLQCFVQAMRQKLGKDFKLQ